MKCPTGALLTYLALAFLFASSASTIVRDCEEELNRESCQEGPPCETCGPCLKHYSGQPGNGTGMCHYTYPFHPRFTLTSGMFPGLQWPSGKIEVAMNVVDLDGDGDLDIFLLPYARPIEYWENQKGTFRKVSSPILYTHQKKHDKITCCDIEDDGLMDFCVISHGATHTAGSFPRHTLTTFLRTSLGTYQKASDLADPFRLLVDQLYGVDGYFKFSFHDLNGDGYKDLLASYKYGRVMYAFWDTEAAAFKVDGVVLLNTHSASVSQDFESTLAAGDLDGDGDTDFLVGPTDGTLHYYQNVGDSHLPVFLHSRHQFLIEDESTELIRSVADFQLIDLNGDGFLDFIRSRCSQNTPTQFEVWINQGTQGKSKIARFATLHAPLTLRAGVVPQLRRRNIVVADFDLDGKEDILVGGVHFLRKTGTDAHPIYEYMAHNDPSFPFDKSLLVLAERLGWMFDLSACKTCGPGNTPILFANTASHTYYGPKKPFEQYSWDEERRLYVRDDNSMFDNKVSMGIVGFADLNHDGIQDAFIHEELDSHDAWLFLGQSGGGFESSPTALDSTLRGSISWNVKGNRGSSWMWRTIKLMDLNDDGFEDAIIWFSEDQVSTEYKPVIVALTRPGGGFQTNIELLDSLPFIPNLIDIDGDGDIDFVSGNLQMIGKNTQQECFSMCLDRGICAQGNHGERVETLSIVENTRKFQGFETLAEAVGSCLCSPQFRGKACQQCAPEYYGLRCEDRCPEFSRTYLGTHDFEYPNASSIEQCICNPSFVKHSTTEGSFVCVCPQGWGFNNATASCDQCPLGSFKNTFSLHECTPCSSVYMDPFITTHDTGAVTQAECKCKASFLWDKQLEKCVCPAGFGLDPFTEVCVECPLGAYSDQLDQGQCTSCPTGTTTFSMGGRSVHDCKPIDCPPGSGRTEDMSCEPCPQNKYRPENETACIPCPKERPVTLGRGSFVNQDCVAARSSFQYYDERAQDQVVKTCEEMGIKEKVACDTDGLQLETLPVLPGFWRIRNTSIDVRKCKPGFCVPSGEGLHYAGDALCSENHRGIMCEACASGFGMKGYKGCIPCSDDEKSLEKSSLGGAITVLTILLLIPLVRVGYVGFRDVSSEDSKGDQQTKSTSFSFAVPAALKSVVPHIATKIRIVLGFYQVFASYSRVTNLHGEDQGSNSAFLQTLEGDFASSIYKAAYLACAATVNFYQRLLLATVVPIAYLAIFGVIILVVRFVRYNNYNEARELTVWIALQLCFLIYPAVSSTILSTFLFEAFPVAIHDMNPFRTLQADRTIDFDSRESKAWRSYAAFMVVVYPVGVLLLFLFFAWCFHTGFAQRKRFSSSVSFLCEPFRPIFFWFESFELLRKLTLTSVFVLVNQEFAANARQIFSMACGLFLVGLFMLKPYKDTKDQLLAELSIFLLLMLGILSTFQVEQGELSAFTFVVLAAEVVFFFLCIPYSTIWREIKEPDVANSNLAKHASDELDSDFDGKKVRHKRFRFPDLIRRRLPERSVELSVYPDTRSVSSGVVDLDPIKFDENPMHIEKS